MFSAGTAPEFKPLFKKVFKVQAIDFSAIEIASMISPSSSLSFSDLILPVIEKNALGILIKNPSNLFYITRFSGEGYVYAADTGKIYLYVDGRYAERAGKECPKDITVS